MPHQEEPMDKKELKKALAGLCIAGLVSGSGLSWYASTANAASG